MKIKALIAIICAMVVVWSLGADTADALSTSTSTARILWDTMSIEYSPPSIIQPQPDVSVSLAEADDWGGYDTDGDEQSGSVDTSASATVSYATGEAWTNDLLLYSNVSAQSDGVGTTDASAYADSNRSYILSLPEPVGFPSWTVTISVDYELSVDASTQYVGETSGGYSAAYISVFEGGNFIAEDLKSLFSGYLFNGDSYTDTSSGTLSFQASFGEQVYLAIEFGTDTDAAVTGVTEPATLSLLALGGLAVLRRKKK
ncbi:MAG: PEP-CTERM sorting domain-containing protein [Planctomycetota bacterium]|jgi:hypothetical protein